MNERSLPLRAGSSPHPRIGITTYAEQVQWSGWNRSAHLLPSGYARLVASADAAPLLLPPVERLDLAATTLSGLDALVIAGGPDVDPDRYAAERHSMTGAPRPQRDEWEIALLRRAEVLAMPVLAVCRGMQLLNVMRGGTLHQHLPDVEASPTHQPQFGTFGKTSVSVSTGSMLENVLGGRVDVQCHHHQAINVIGETLEVVARSSDGTIEAVEDRNQAFLVGVQWHPEEDATDLRLFGALVEAAVRYKQHNRMDSA